MKGTSNGQNSEHGLKNKKFVNMRRTLGAWKTKFMHLASYLRRKKQPDPDISS